MTDLLVRRADKPLIGSVPVPSDKSIGHRALLFAALTNGRSRITGFSYGEDNVSTANALRALGVAIHDTSPTSIEVEGVGLFGLRAADHTLDCGNSGTTMRLLAGLLCAQPFTSILVGDETLMRRPMMRVAKPLRMRGATVAGEDHKSKAGEITAPLRLGPPASRRSPRFSRVRERSGERAGEERDPPVGPLRARRDLLQGADGLARSHRATDAGDGGAHPHDGVDREARHRRMERRHARVRDGDSGRSLGGGLSPRGGADRRRVARDGAWRRGEPGAYGAARDRPGHGGRGSRLATPASARASRSPTSARGPSPSAVRSSAVRSSLAPSMRSPSPAHSPRAPRGGRRSPTPKSSG